MIWITLLACRAEPEAEDCWYCEDSDATVDESSDDTGTSGKDTGKGGKDTGKGGKDTGGSGSLGDTWSASVELDLSSGAMTWERGTQDGDCTLKASFTTLEETDTCAECSFAAELTLGTWSVVSDTGGCEDIDDLLALEGQTTGYGNGGASLGEYQGVEYFTLYVGTQGSWSASTGYSGLGASAWTFGEK